MLWDTAGLERFRSITKSYYKRSSIALIVYDITNRDSFYNLEYWYYQLVNNCNSNITIVIVGNKTDLTNRKVSYDEGFQFAEKYDLLFFETSIYDHKQITNIFLESSRLVIRQKVNTLSYQTLLDTGIHINEETDHKVKKTKWCCFLF
jgi:small GTP-binding protein